MKDTEKNKQSTDNEFVYNVNYRFSYLELVKINKALESLISVSVHKYADIGIDTESISALHDFKNCLCEAISEHIIRPGNPRQIVEPFILITNNKQYYGFD